jgi:hypothetical protein
MPNEDIGGPFVQIACICQTVLQEANGAPSLIRIQDRIGVAGPADAMQPQPFHHLALVVVLKSGTLREMHKLTIQPISPTGQKLQKVESQVLFEGDDRGVILAMPVPLVATEPGLYWFDVLVEESVATRIPLRVIYQKIPTPPRT